MRKEGKQILIKTRQQGTMTGKRSKQSERNEARRSYQCGPIGQWRPFQKRDASLGTLLAPH